MGKPSRRIKNNGSSMNGTTTTTTNGNGPMERHGSSKSLTTKQQSPVEKRISSVVHLVVQMVIQLIITLVIVKISKKLLFGLGSGNDVTEGETTTSTTSTVSSNIVVDVGESMELEPISVPLPLLEVELQPNPPPQETFRIPTEFAGPLSNYPNPINITQDLQQTFHPVVKFPHVWIEQSAGVVVDNDVNHNNQEGLNVVVKSTPKNKRKKIRTNLYRVLDFTNVTGSSQLILPQDQEEYIKERKWNATKRHWKNLFQNKDAAAEYTVGKYDENRKNLYSSSHFLDETNSIDGYDGARTVHIGIDLGGPVGTKIHSFYDGYIHSLGYNDELGDYGYVIVVEHCIPSYVEVEGTNCASSSTGYNLNGGSSCVSSEFCNDEKSVPLWALYGHLDSNTIKNRRVGQKVKRGEVVGKMGNVHENGGWSMPHVHFQLSTLRPVTHDMPGAVAVKDRAKALFNYPDPRFVLGNLY